MRSYRIEEHESFLRYERLGADGPATIYLSGLGLASFPIYSPVLSRDPSLSARHSLFIDLFGCGYSDAPSTLGYSLDDHAQVVAELLDSLSLSACSVVGFSQGGAVAITLAATRPELVDRLVLLESNLDPLDLDAQTLSAQIARQSETKFVRGGFQALIDFLGQSAREGNETFATITGVLQKANPVALYRSAVGLVAGTQPTMRERLLSMTIPRTYIFGEQSLPDSDWDKLQAAGIQVLQVDNAGHGMTLDNPAGSAQAIVTGLTYESGH